MAARTHPAPACWRRHLANIYRLGVKELWSLWRDPMMLVLIVYTFTVSVYIAATAMPETLHQAPIAIVDEDQSALSQQIVAAFYPPQFRPPAMITREQVDPGMDAGTTPSCWTSRPTSSATCWPAARRPCSSTSTPRA
jgi:ABC-2 type transport system permease protein